MGTVIFKIVSKQLWDQASDGYIHLSDKSQAEETARKHFAGQHDLLLVAFDAAAFEGNLRWEASRGGALFPHIYGTLNPAQALWVKALPWNGMSHEFPERWTA
jgi:uncharacterized protein (DUF952 family)